MTHAQEPDPAFVEVWRGDVVESRHRVHLAVVRPNGQLLASAGDPDLVTFMRSTAKPFQALFFADTLTKFGLGPRHHALACASHLGEDVHVATAREILEAAEVPASALRCGIHPPFSAATREALRERGEAPTVLHNNCSGKHSGMLAAAKANGWPLENYTAVEHPLQRGIAVAVAQVTGAADLHVAIDGCGVPTFALPLRHAALAFARLADPAAGPAVFRDRLSAAFDAMSGNPLLVGGTDSFDTRLMEAEPGVVVSKFGAEMFHALALRGTRWGALGVVLKIEDGGNATRARDVAVLRVLDRLGVAAEAELLPKLTTPVLHNAAGTEVGRVQAAFELRFEPDQELL